MNMNYSPNYIPGALTHQKIERLGTSDAVLKSRRAYDRNHGKLETVPVDNYRYRFLIHIVLISVALATAHLHRVMNSRCQVPQPRCVRTDTDPSKIYSPHCTILHRCAEDTGCCHELTQICAPKTQQDVDLPFLVSTQSRRRLRDSF